MHITDNFGQVRSVTGLMALLRACLFVCLFALHGCTYMWLPADVIKTRICAAADRPARRGASRLRGVIPLEFRRDLQQ